jgi:hypothetical protein
VRVDHYAADQESATAALAESAKGRAVIEPVVVAAVEAKVDLYSPRACRTRNTMT